MTPDFKSGFVAIIGRPNVGMRMVLSILKFNGSQIV